MAPMAGRAVAAGAPPVELWVAPAVALEAAELRRPSMLDLAASREERAAPVAEAIAPEMLASADEASARALESSPTALESSPAALERRDWTSDLWVALLMMDPPAEVMSPMTEPPAEVTSPTIEVTSPATEDKKESIWALAAPAARTVTKTEVKRMMRVVRCGATVRSLN